MKKHLMECNKCGKNVGSLLSKQQHKCAEVKEEKATEVKPEVK